MSAKLNPLERVETTLELWSQRFDAELERLLRPGSGRDVPAKLAEAMRYTALAPGKRLRPYLTCTCCRLVGGQEQDALSAAAAIECVHAFSLIHDDLPSMDDDARRRGQPSNHVRFGEGMAVLAGDALLTLAFELLASDPTSPERSRRTVLELAQACGWAGMIGGQVDDTETAPHTRDRDLLDSIRGRKTGRLMAAACRIGAICGCATAGAVESLGRYGLQLGIAFQVADDLLDVAPREAGVGSDLQPTDGAGGNKQTRPGCVGSVEVRRQAHESVEQAIAALESWGPEADELRTIARFVIERKS
ncbi:MAG: polyprenyl synthetase family protein [Planctomycetes bacterium]|nr:polyprenyl synthetase family protein [Planctomycetota bacterium]